MRKTKQSILLAFVTLIFLITVYFLHHVFPVVENILYDLSFYVALSETSDSIVIIGIDSKSTGKTGAWPWPRSTLAHLIEQIESYSPRAIALDFLFPKRPNDPGSDSLASVFSKVSNLLIGMRVESISGETESSIAMVTPDAYRHRFMMVKNEGKLSKQFFYSAQKVDFGDPSLSQYADRGGFLNVSTSRTSQKVRELVHVIRAGNEYYPSFGLAAAAAFLRLKPDQFVLDMTGSVFLGTKQLQLARSTGTVRLNFRGKPGTIKTLSASDMLEGAIDSRLIRDKLVFVGITDAPSSHSDFFITPAGTQFPGVEIWATAALDILTNSWIKKSNIVFSANLLILFLLFPGCILLFPGSKRKYAIIISTIIMVLSIAAGFLFLQKTGYFWNSGFHLYAWVLLLGWLTTQKSDLIIVEKPSLYLDPKESDETYIMSPPNECDFLQAVPSVETAAYVVKQIAPTTSDGTSPLNNLSDTNEEADLIADSTNNTQPSVQYDSSVVTELQQLADGRIVKSLGSGGMADVYLIWHPRMEVYRAVKVIKPGQPGQWLERFETEIRIFANLNHPNIVQCYGVGEWHSLPYLEMEYVSGASLGEILKICKYISPTEVLTIGILVCRALNYAHNQVVTVYGKTYKGIIHRDLKPANILLSKNGHIKLNDFGIARPGAVSLHTVDTGKIIGTLPYLSPEQVNGEILTHKTDIYSLGVTLYEMVTGDRAYPQIDIPSLITAKTKSDFKPLKSSSLLPKGVIDIIERAMTKDPGKRFASANEMSKSIEEVLHSMIQDKDTFILAGLLNRAFKAK